MQQDDNVDVFAKCWLYNLRNFAKITRMPITKIISFCDENGHCEFMEWFAVLPRRARVKCLTKIKRLEMLGHELRRPEADLLRDKIYELRIPFEGVQYRILYFFYGNQVAILTGGLTKKDRVPPVEIERAIAKKRLFETNPKIHTYDENYDEADNEN